MKQVSFADRVSNALAKSCICVGLDPVAERLPTHLGNDLAAILKFNKSIIDATFDLVSAFKPNLAFYEVYGPKGWDVLAETIAYVKTRSKDAIVIADAKRGDIDTTARMYARAIYEDLCADAVTVNPYMGSDSVEPFIDRADRGVFVLALTSNQGSADFQKLLTEDGPIFEIVARRALDWNRRGNVGLVVGATNASEMSTLRSISGTMPFLIPGIGAQGGDLRSAVTSNFNGRFVNSWVNVSRSVLYASSGEDFAEAARASVATLGAEIRKILSAK